MTSARQSFHAAIARAKPVLRRDRGVVMGERYQLAELRNTGLLWLINRVVFHPRGYALALHVEDDGTAHSWSLLGDGTEVLTMGADPPTNEERLKYGARSEAELFALVKRMLP